MPENTYPVEVFKTDYICDDCGEGRMYATAQRCGPQILHKCTKCEKKKLFQFSYPTVMYREIKKTVGAASSIH